MNAEKILTAGVTVLIGIVGVAVIALLVSSKSDTSGVIGAASGGFACMLKTAITGNNSCSGSLTEQVNSRLIIPGGGSGRQCFTGNC